MAGVHKTLWPDQPETKSILNVAILTGAEKPEKVYVAGSIKVAETEKQLAGVSLEGFSKGIIYSFSLGRGWILRCGLLTRYDAFQGFVMSGSRCMAPRRSSVERCV